MFYCRYYISYTNNNVTMSLSMPIINWSYIKNTVCQFGKTFSTLETMHTSTFSLKYQECFEFLLNQIILFFSLNITQCWRKHQRHTQKTFTGFSLSKQIRGIWLVCNISPIIKVFCKCIFFMNKESFLRRKISHNIKWKYRFF